MPTWTRRSTEGDAGDALGGHREACADAQEETRADRLVAVLVVTGFVGLGLPQVVLGVVLALLAVASLVTVFQRMLTVRAQALASKG